MNDSFYLFVFLFFLFLFYLYIKDYEQDMSEIKERLTKIEIIIKEYR